MSSVLSKLPDLEAELQRQNARAEELIVSNPREALDTASRACELARTHAILETQPASLWAQGIALGLLEEPERSDRLLHEALKLSEQLGQRHLQFRSINGLGANAHRRGQYGKAFSYYHSYLSYARHAGDRTAQARALGNIGLLFQEMGEITRSLEIAEQVLAIGTAVDQPLLCVTSAANIVDARLALFQFDAALEVVARWRPIAQRHGFRIQDALLLGSRGAARLGTGHISEALLDLEEAVAQGRELGNFHEICGPLVNLGEAYQRAGRVNDALAVLNEAFERCGNTDSLSLQAKASRVLMTLYQAEGRFEEALALAHTVLRLQEHVHGERLSRRTEVLSVEFELDQLRNQAELERQKMEVLRESNALLQRLQENLQHEATHDALTGLYNRRCFLQLLDATLLSNATAGGRFGIAYLDLDDFKAVNDTHGHPAGDALLAEFARRLSSAAHADDVVARLGGDEFAIILRAPGSAVEAEHALRQLEVTVCGPVLWGETALHCSASVGFALYPEHGGRATELLHHADAAMYQKKRRRRRVHGLGDRDA